MVYLATQRRQSWASLILIRELRQYIYLIKYLSLCRIVHFYIKLSFINVNWFDLSAFLLIMLSIYAYLFIYVYIYSIILIILRIFFSIFIILFSYYTWSSSLHIFFHNCYSVLYPLFFSLILLFLFILTIYWLYSQFLFLFILYASLLEISLESVILFVLNRIFFKFIWSTIFAVIFILFFSVTFF